MGKIEKSFSRFSDDQYLEIKRSDEVLEATIYENGIYHKEYKRPFTSNSSTSATISFATPSGVTSTYDNIPLISYDGSSTGLVQCKFVVNILNNITIADSISFVINGLFQYDASNNVTLIGTPDVTKIGTGGGSETATLTGNGTLIEINLSNLQSVAKDYGAFCEMYTLTY